jgi:MFS family permease
MEMVGRSKLSNAVALNSVLVNAARIIGPAVGGLLIVSVGIGYCFLINSVTYFVFIGAVGAMRTEDIDRTVPEERQPGQLRDALAYVRDAPVIRSVLVMSAAIGIFAYEFEVVLPLLARFTFGGDADTFGTMFAFMGIGAVGGGLVVATRATTPPRWVLGATYAFGLAILATAVAPTIWLAYSSLVVVGASSTAFLTASNSVVQLRAEPQMRGRVVGLRASAILGARPIGAPIVGWVGEHLGARAALGLGAVAAIGVAMWAHGRMSSDEAQLPAGAE